MKMPNISVPKNSTKGDYGKITFDVVLGLFHTLGVQLFSPSKKEYKIPPTFEALGSNTSSIVLYETLLPANRTRPALLKATVADRALVYTDWRLAGILSRTENIFSMPIYDPYATTLQIVVENQGHLNYGNLVADFKVTSCKHFLYFRTLNFVFMFKDLINFLLAIFVVQKLNKDFLSRIREYSTLY